MKHFASDNHAPAHPEVLAAIAAANDGHATAYGADEWSARAEALLREHFGPQSRAFLVFNGTGANVAAVDALTRPWEAVICADNAHLNTDECGAPERLAQTKLLPVAAEHGKLTADQIRAWPLSPDDEHHAQPRVVTITQSTELGTVYAVDEVRALADAAHERGMLLHVDGARLANAAAALGVGLGELTTGAGVDAISFGGTKNGLLLGEAVVFGRAELAERFAFTRKQLAQLASKSRFLGAQFEALLRGDLWLRNAVNANAMARRLADAVAALDGVELVHPVEANALFARLPAATIERLLDSLPGEHFFYVWDEQRHVVRWMCSWDTTPEDVDAFAAAIANAL